jgi:hypothetical protein
MTGASVNTDQQPTDPKQRYWCGGASAENGNRRLAEPESAHNASMGAPGAEVAGDMRMPSHHGADGAGLAGWTQQHAVLQLPSLQELTPLETQIISPLLACAFGIPLSALGQTGNGASNACQSQGMPIMQSQQPTQSQTQQAQSTRQQQPPATHQFQQVANVMGNPVQYSNSGLAADSQDRQNYGQQLAAFSLAYTSPMGLGQGLQQTGPANAHYPYPNFYGFDAATAMANPYTLQQFHGERSSCVEYFWISCSTFPGNTNTTIRCNVSWRIVMPSQP